jgi:uncharacterized protein
LNGRVAGISGIFRGVFRGRTGDTGWRLLFLVGLLAGGALVARLLPGSVTAPPRSLLMTAIAGLLVGVGVTLGGGCTSGHGVCGISSGSKRSIVATVVFMATGIATAVVANRL